MQQKEKTTCMYVLANAWKHKSRLMRKFPDFFVVQYNLCVDMVIF